MTHLQRRIRIKEFSMLIGRSRSTFDRWRKDGRIPKEDDKDPNPYWLEYNVQKFIENS